MKQIFTTNEIFHSDLLHYEFKQALGDKFIGISTYGSDRPIAINVTDDIKDSDTEIIESVLKNHNPDAELPDAIKPIPTTEQIMQEKIDSLTKRLEAVEAKTGIA